MKNKKYLKVLCCGIMCLSLFVSNCFAITHKRYWWGDEYIMGNDEIAEFRLTIQELQSDKIRQGHYASASVAIMTLPLSPGASLGAGIAMETLVAELNRALDRLVIDLERWERKGKAIIVHIPNVIHGWSIKEK